MKWVWRHLQGSHLMVGNLDLGWIGAGIEFRLHLESCARCQSRLDQTEEFGASLRTLGQEIGDPTCEPADPTLVQVLQRLRDARGLKGCSPVGAGDLYFLGPADRPGLLGILGGYEVQEVIGQGGMGVVFKAFDQSLQRVVAIKIMAPHLATSAAARQRFVREARATASVRNEHVIAIHAVEEANDPPYLVMEYISGLSLQERLDRDGPLQLQEILRIGTQTQGRLVGGGTRTFIVGISGTALGGGVAVRVNADGQLGSVASTARFKQNIKPMDKASEAIHALKPVTFHYKKELDPEGIPQFGLAAEDVEKVNPDLVVRDADGKVYTVRYDAVNAMLLNEFLKEHRTVQEQKAAIARLASTVAKQEATAAHQQKQIEALTAGLQKVSAQVEMSRLASQMVDNNQ